MQKIKFRTEYLQLSLVEDSLQHQKLIIANLCTQVLLIQSNQFSQDRLKIMLDLLYKLDKGWALLIVMQDINKQMVERD